MERSHAEETTRYDEGRNPRLLADGQLANWNAWPQLEGTEYDQSSCQNELCLRSVSGGGAGDCGSGGNISRFRVDRPSKHHNVQCHIAITCARKIFIYFLQFLILDTSCQFASSS